MASRIKNPVRIRIGTYQNVVLVNNTMEDIEPLNPGIMFSTEHYGFNLIIDTNQSTKEKIYPTETKVSATCMEKNKLYVFEEGKKRPWIFSNTGKLICSIEKDDIDLQYKEEQMLASYYNAFLNRPVIDNPLVIEIYPKTDIFGKIVFPDKDYPLEPGLMIGNTKHYGFIMKVIDYYSKELISQKTYSTQAPIDGICIDSKDQDQLKIFEHGKYSSWIFTCEGDLIQQAQYNTIYPMDQESLKTQKETKILIK